MGVSWKWKFNHEKQIISIDVQGRKKNLFQILRLESVILNEIETNVRNYYLLMINKKKKDISPSFLSDMRLDFKLFHERESQQLQE